jgi:RNA polymerase sigma factor (sigma-70 family)
MSDASDTGNNNYTEASSQLPYISDEDLLAKFDRLIIYEAKKIAKSYAWGDEWEDIAQMARIKLTKLPQDVRGAGAYVRQTIYYSCCDSIRKLKIQTNGLLFINDAEEDSAPWTISEEDLPPDATKSVIDTLHDHDLYTRLTSTLTSEQTLVVGIWYGLDGGDPVTSPRSVARRTGIKESRVSEILRAALAKLRNAAAAITSTTP